MNKHKKKTKLKDRRDIYLCFSSIFSLNILIRAKRISKKIESPLKVVHKLWSIEFWDSFLMRFFEEFWMRWMEIDTKIDYEIEHKLKIF